METRTGPNTLSFRVYVTPEEKTQILHTAADCRLSMSAYCRTLALGGMPPSRGALEQIDGLAKAMADLNRLGGLMKMFLTNGERLQDMGRDMAVTTIDDILVDIRFAAAKLCVLIDAISGVNVGEDKPKK